MFHHHWAVRSCTPASSPPASAPRPHTARRSLCHVARAPAKASTRADTLPAKPAPPAPAERGPLVSCVQSSRHPYIAPAAGAAGGRQHLATRQRIGRGHGQVQPRVTLRNQLIKRQRREPQPVERFL